MKSSVHINTTAAETVELGTSREEVRMVLEGASESIAESILEGKRALDLPAVLVRVGLASSIVAAITLAVINRADLPAGGEALARLVASLAEAGAKELVVRHGHLGDLSDHAVDAETDLALRLEDTEVVLGGLELIVELGDGIRNEVLRDSSLILVDDHLARGGGLDIGVLHVTKEGLSLEVDVTILAGLSGRLLLCIVVGILEHGAEVDLQAVSDDGLDPAMRPAGSDVGLEDGILKASIRRGRGRSRGSDVDVGREGLVVPHGARIASRHEEDKLVEHLLLLHGLKALCELVVVEVLLSGHADEVRSTVVIIEDENVIIGSGLEDLARTRARSLTRENSHEVSNGGILSDVILDNTGINIDVGARLIVELVVDLTRERIGFAVGDIILEESDDALVRNTSLMSKLIRLVHGGLVTIVQPAPATGDKDNPGVATIGLAALNSLTEHLVLLICKSNGNKSKNKKQSLHYCYYLKK